MEKKECCSDGSSAGLSGFLHHINLNSVRTNCSHHYLLAEETAGRMVLYLANLMDVLMVVNLHRSSTPFTSSDGFVCLVQNPRRSRVKFEVQRHNTVHFFGKTPQASERNTAAKRCSLNFRNQPATLRNFVRQKLNEGEKSQANCHATSLQKQKTKQTW